MPKFLQFHHWVFLSSPTSTFVSPLLFSALLIHIISPTLETVWQRWADRVMCKPACWLEGGVMICSCDTYVYMLELMEGEEQEDF